MEYQYNIIKNENFSKKNIKDTHFINTDDINSQNGGKKEKTKKKINLLKATLQNIKFLKINPKKIVKNLPKKKK